MQELHDDTQKVMQDESMSRREKADRKIRELLNDEQKKSSINSSRSRTLNCTAI